MRASQEHGACEGPRKELWAERGAVKRPAEGCVRVLQMDNCSSCSMWACKESPFCSWWLSHSVCVDKVKCFHCVVQVLW